jgi:hypothetical protein
VGFSFLRILQEKREPTSGLEPLTPAPATSEKYGGAGHCSGLLWLAESSYLSGIFFTGLHTIAEHCALGDVEVM